MGGEPDGAADIRPSRAVRFLSGSVLVYLAGIGGYLLAGDGHLTVGAGPTASGWTAAGIAAPLVLLADRRLHRAGRDGRP